MRADEPRAAPVVVGVRDTPVSRAAITDAAMLAIRRRVELHLVATYDPGCGRVRDGAPPFDAADHADPRAEAEALLRDAARHVAVMGVAVRQHVLEGSQPEGVRDVSAALARTAPQALASTGPPEELVGRRASGGVMACVGSAALLGAALTGAGPALAGLPASFGRAGAAALVAALVVLGLHRRRRGEAVAVPGRRLQLRQASARGGSPRGGVGDRGPVPAVLVLDGTRARPLPPGRDRAMPTADALG